MAKQKKVKKDKKDEIEQPSRLEQLRLVFGPWGSLDGNEHIDYWSLMNHLSDYITEQYGHRCPNSAGGCACCQAWAVYDLARAIFMEPE
jgi:hypothetical protein